MKQYANDQVTIFRSRNENAELERINRLTGLEFSSLPDSLVLNKTGNHQVLDLSLFNNN